MYCSWGATTGTVSVPQLRIIDEVTENFSIASGTLATGTLIDNNNAPTVATISASATEGSDVYSLYIKQPFCSKPLPTFVLTNGTAGGADYTTTNVDVTVPAGATTGTVFTNCGCD
jgi:hypothetical protein